MPPDRYRAVMALKRAVIRILPGPITRGARSARRRARLEVEKHGSLQRRINAGITVERLSRRPRQPGTVWAVSMMKNEDDIATHSVRHMLDQGVDGIIVVDNRSDDRTRWALESLRTEDTRVHVGSDLEPAFHQGMKVSRLARLAWEAGADWVVPFDADELWFADDMTVADRLRLLRGDRAWCDYRNAYPLARHGELDLDSDRPVQVDRHARAWMRIAFRAQRSVFVGEGNHDLRTFGPTPVKCLHMLHLSYRSLEQYSRKADQGVAALQAAGKGESIATHWRGWAALSPAERDARWRSYLRGEEGEGDAFVSTDRVEVPNPARWKTWDPDMVFED